MAQFSFSKLQILNLAKIIIVKYSLKEVVLRKNGVANNLIKTQIGTSECNYSELSCL